MHQGNQAASRRQKRQMDSLLRKEHCPADVLLLGPVRPSRPPRTSDLLNCPIINVVCKPLNFWSLVTSENKIHKEISVIFVSLDFFFKLITKDITMFTRKI